MRRFMIVAGLLAVASSTWTVAHACGDKFLMVGRSGRFNQAYAAIYPATILLYAPDGRAASAAILDPKFQSSLTRAGHRIEVVKNEEQAVQMLLAGRFDIVLADATDADALKAKAAQSSSQPIVMPVLFNPTKAEAEAIKARYQCELKPSDRPARYLSRIDEEMQARVKQRAIHKAS